MKGLLAAELREVKDKYLDISNSLLLPNGPNWGLAEADDILAGDFVWDGTNDTLTNIQAVCACELAAYFRAPHGGAAASFEAVKIELERQ